MWCICARTYSAADAVNTIGNEGFTHIEDNGVYHPGDVMIYGRKGTKIPHGHIQIFDGKNWISDFIQKSKVPGMKYLRAGLIPSLWRDLGDQTESEISANKKDTENYEGGTDDGAVKGNNTEQAIAGNTTNSTSSFRDSLFGNDDQRGQSDAEHNQRVNNYIENGVIDNSMNTLRNNYVRPADSNIVNAELFKPTNPASTNLQSTGNNITATNDIKDVSSNIEKGNTLSEQQLGKLDQMVSLLSQIVGNDNNATQQSREATMASTRVQNTRVSSPNRINTPVGSTLGKANTSSTNTQLRPEPVITGRA